MGFNHRGGAGGPLSSPRLRGGEGRGGKGRGEGGEGKGSGREGRQTSRHGAERRDGL